VNERQAWLTILIGGSTLAVGLGALIYLQTGKIGEAETEVETLRTKVVSSRKLIEGTSTLEREVIVQREMSEVIRDVLPDEEDMNNWVRTIQGFSEESGVRIRALKKKPDDPRAKKGAFDDVMYTFTLESDAFELLDFVNLVETHERLMRVPRLKITAAKRQKVEESGAAAHKAQLDIETFVYEPKNEAPPVKIEGYERKRDLMVGEINRRRLDLAFTSFTYRGARGRRDPWVDPRVPVDGGSSLSVPEQMDIVQGLYLQMQDVLTQWGVVKGTKNVVEEMMANHDLEEMLVHLEEEVRRVEVEGAITYLPSQRRFQLEVVDSLVALRQALSAIDGSRGPSVERLREVLDSMDRYLVQEEYEHVLDTFRIIANQLDFIEDDPLRKPFVEKLRRKALIARIVREFEEIEIDVGGVAIIDGRPAVAHINGEPLSAGDMIGNNLLIKEIRSNEIEFIYRGVVLARSF
jgi:hypothetical protein